MQEQDFPALYRSADDLSLKSQKHFFRALRVHLVTLVVAAILLWTPPARRWFDRWHLRRHPAPVAVEPRTDVFYGPLPRYR